MTNAHIISNYDTNLFKERLFPWYKSSDESIKTSSKSNGIIFKINNDYFVLTTGFQIRDSITNYLLLDDKMIKLNIHSISNEFNLALLKIIDYLPTKYYTIQDFEIKLNKNVIINGTRNKLNQIVIDKLINVHIPHNLFTIYKFNSDVKVGTPIFHSKKIQGIVSEQKDNKLIAIPSKVICRYLSEIMLDNKFEICSLYFEHNIVNGEYIVVDTRKINYNIGAIYDRNNFFKYDIILDVDGNPLINGKVNDPSIELDLPLKTYIMLNYYPGGVINFLVKRNERTKNIIVNLRSINTILSIPYKNTIDTKYRKVNGIIYVELDENIIRYYFKNKVKIDKIMDLFLTANIRNNRKIYYAAINDELQISNNLFSKINIK